MSFSSPRPHPHRSYSLRRSAVAATALLAAAACGPNGEPPAREASAAETLDVVGHADAELEAASSPDSVPTVPMRPADRVPGGHLLLDAWHGDTRGRVVELYVQGERDGAGRMMWDDGHHWLLVVRDGQRMARLVDAFVPNGLVRFWVVTGARPEPTIVTQIDSGSTGVETAEWVWDADNEVWTSPSTVRVVGNLVHRTEPSALQ